MQGHDTPAWNLHSNPPRPTPRYVLNSAGDIAWYQLEHGLMADVDGYVDLERKGATVRMPLQGLYRVQRLIDGIPVPGPGLLLNADEFNTKYRTHEEPTSPSGCPDSA